MTNQAHSKEFFDLIRNIGETKSKQEEDKIIIKEIATLKQHFSNNKATLKIIKEYVVRALYCEMLGHDASFSYIHAIKLTSSKTVLEKRVGYLAISLCIPKEHELMLLLIANLQKDLSSTNYLIVCAALTAAAKLVNEETIPALLPSVINLRKHQNALVRKKIIALIHTFYLLSATSVPNILEYAKEALCDRDPSVMGASLCLLHDMAKEDQCIPELKELTSSFVSILKQIVDHRLHRDFDYHRLPAPWIQIKILQILAILGKEDKTTSELMLDTLRETMQRGDNALNIGHAVVYETVKTITAIYPNNLLLENAASAISRFVTSSNHNLKYLGIVCLTEIIKINPIYARQHSMVVMGCLEDIDETIRRRTLSLLYTMTNSDNVTVIVKKLLEFARKSLDTHMREEIIQRVSLLAEKFCPSIFWFIDTMNTLFEIGPEFVPPRAIQNMMTVIAEGIGTEESADEDDKMRVYCVDSFFEVTEKKAVLHDLHIQVIAWVLGEYGYLSSQHDKEEIIERLCDIAEKQLELPETRCVLISAIMKLVAQTGGRLPAGAEEIIQKYKNSKNVDLQQRCYEFLQLIDACNKANNHKQVMDAVLPVDGSCEDIEVDSELSWLNKYTQQALDAGYRPYLAPENRSQLAEIVEPPRTKELKMTPYQPVTKQFGNTLDSGLTNHPELPNVSVYPSDHKPQTGLDAELLRNKPRRWQDEWADDDKIDQPKLNLPGSGSNIFTAPSSLPSNFGGSMGPMELPAPKPVKEEPPSKISEKQKKLANDIFGAPSEDTSSKKAPKRRTRSVKKEEEQVAVPPPEPIKKEIPRRISNANKPQVAKTELKQNQKVELMSLDDLLDFGSTPTQAYNVMDDHVQDNSGDMFGDMSVKNTNSDGNMFEDTNVRNDDSEYDQFFTPKPEQKPSTKFVDSLFSLDQPVMGTRTSANTAPVEEDTGISAFGSLLTPNKGTAKTQVVTSNDDMLFPSNVKRQPTLLTRLINTAQRANEDALTLCRDTYLNVEYYKFWKDDSVTLALVFNTERGFTLSNLNCQFQPPTRFEMKFETDSPNSFERGNTITLQRLEPGTPITLLIHLRLNSFGFGLGFMGTIIYTDNEKQIHNQTLNVQLDVVDLMRPLQMTSEEFGQLWTSYPHEKRIQVKGNYSVPTFTNKIENDFKIKIIQVIDQEAIGAAQLINTNEKILFHGKVIKTGVAFTTKARDKPITEILCRLANAKLA
jgi:AP-4 complex subunit epsilon-1